MTQRKCFPVSLSPCQTGLFGCASRVDGSRATPRGAHRDRSRAPVDHEACALPTMSRLMLTFQVADMLRVLAHGYAVEDESGASVTKPMYSTIVVILQVYLLGVFTCSLSILRSSAPPVSENEYLSSLRPGDSVLIFCLASVGVVPCYVGKNMERLCPLFRPKSQQFLEFSMSSSQLLTVHLSRRFAFPRNLRVVAYTCPPLRGLQDASAEEIQDSFDRIDQVVKHRDASRVVVDGYS